MPRDSAVRLVWVYKRRRNGKLKARLCAQGCAQAPGVDFNQTFCGTLRVTSLRAMSAVAARMDLAMHGWDFVAAFLQGELEDSEVLYCQPPPGYERDHLDSSGRPIVCEVCKPIYGMAQAGRRWQRTIYPSSLTRSRASHSCTRTLTSSSSSRAVRPSSWAATSTISLHFTLTLALALCTTSS